MSEPGNQVAEDPEPAGATRTDFAFIWPYRVRYRDIDPQGVVYFPTYLEIVNSAIHEYFRWLGFPYRLGADPERGDDFHIVRSVVDYLAPVRFDEDVDVAVRTLRLGRSSLTLATAIFGGDGGGPRTTAEIVWVNTNQTTHKSTALPAALVEAIQARDDPDGNTAKWSKP